MSLEKHECNSLFAPTTPAMAQDIGQVEVIVDEVVRKRIDGGDLRRLSPFQGAFQSQAMSLVLAVALLSLLPKAQAWVPL